MHVLKLIPLFSLFLVLGGQVMFIPDQAYAAKSCCRSCPCTIFCICPGVGTCPWFYCNTDDSATLQTQTVINYQKLDISGSYASSPSSVLRSYSIDRLIARTSSDQCDKNNLALKFFHRAEDRLKFERDFLKYNASEDNTIVTSQMTLNE